MKTRTIQCCGTASTLAGDPRKPASGASLPNLSSIIGKDQTLLILRDYSSNVRRMLQVVEKMEAQ